VAANAFGEKVVLERLGSRAKTFAPALGRLCAIDDGRALSAAFYAMTMMGPDADGAIPELVLLFNRSGEAIRLRVIEVLGAIGSARSQAILKKILKSSNARLRDKAAKLLR